MVYLALLLMLVGIGCLIAEIFIPGFGVFGICGAVSIFVAIVLTIVFVPFGIYLVIAEILATVVVVYSAFKWLKSKQVDTSIILKETLNEEKKEFGDLENLIGEEGRCKTPLKPFGNVDLSGVIMEAFSDGEYINKGELIKVVKVAGNKIYVRKANAN